jgi:hypothetical protein
LAEVVRKITNEGGTRERAGSGEEREGGTTRNRPEEGDSIGGKMLQSQLLTTYTTYVACSYTTYNEKIKKVKNFGVSGAEGGVGGEGVRV